MDSIKILESNFSTPYTDDLNDSSLTSQKYRRRREAQEDNSDETLTDLEDSNLNSRNRREREAQEDNFIQTSQIWLELRKAITLHLFVWFTSRPLE